MSALELLAPETVDAVPYSVRLAERRRLSARTAAARADRRAYQRRSASDLGWLQAARLIGAGTDVRLIDLSEGGALIEVDAPLRPGVTMTLQLSGPGIHTAVPLEVLRCYIASLRGSTATYRGACAFAHLIEVPGQTHQPAPAADPPGPSAREGFVGTEAALAYLLERCATSSPSRTQAGHGSALDKSEVILVLDALKARTSTPGSDLLSRYTSDLLAAILPALRAGASRDVAIAALEERVRSLPGQCRSQLQPTSGRLASLIDHCVAPADVRSGRIIGVPAWTEPAAIALASSTPDRDSAAQDVGEPKSAFQKIVVRQADGKILKGYTQDFHPSRPQFSLWPAINATPKERVVVQVVRLKAVFFVRDFAGNAKYQKSKAFGARGQGRRLEVTFADGEILLGTTLNYRPDAQGFFVSPADPAANNTRVFVVSQGLRRVRFL